jgi:hypothetical protein
MQQLQDAVKQCGENWATISREVFHSRRTPLACEMKYMSIVWNEGLSSKLIKAKQRFGGDWDAIARVAFDSQWTPEALSKFNLRWPWTNEQDLRLRDAVADYGEDWKSIAKQEFQWFFTPMQLERRYKTITTFRWTNTELEKLRAAVQKYNNDWARIAYEVFGGMCTTSQLQKKWESLQKHQQQQHDEQVPQLMSRGELIVNNEQLNFYLGRELDQQWSRFTRMLGSHVERLQLVYNTPMRSRAQSEDSDAREWSKHENTILFSTAKEYNNDWSKVAEELPGRSIASIRSRYGGMTWNSQEINTFEEALETHGTDWSKVAECVGTKSPGQCWSYWRRSTGADLKLDVSPATAQQQG